MSKKRIIEYQNLSLSRVISCLICWIVAIINMVVFGIESGRHIPYGSVINFEGPSYFFVSGLFPLLIGLIMGISFIFSYHKGTISIEGNKYKFTEKRIIKKINTEIERENILSINLANNETGIKYLWLIVFIPYLVITYHFGLLNLNQPFIIGIPVTATVVLISVILTAVVIIILFAFPPWLLQIYAKEGYYEFWFDPLKNKQQVIDGILDIMEVKTVETEMMISEKKNKPWDVLLIGLAFLIVGMINIISFNPHISILNLVISWTLITIGTYILITTIKELNPGESEKLFLDDYNKHGDLRINIRGKYYQKYFWIKSPDEKKFGLAYKSFEVFWGWVTFFLFLFFIVNIIQYWLIYLSLIDPIIYTIIGIAILFFHTLIIFSPRKCLLLIVDYYNFKIQLRISSQEGRESENIFSRLKYNLSEESLRKGLIFRLLFILITIVIAVVIFLLQYF